MGDVPTIGIVIVNWNSGAFLGSCVASLARCSVVGFAIDRVVVIDNASSDGSASNLNHAALPVETVLNGQNQGFAKGCNQGAARAGGDYLLFLNPDTRVFEGTLSAVVAFMELPGNDQVAVCGVRLVDDEGRTGASCARFPTVRTFLGKATGLDRVLRRFFPPHFLTEDELREDRRVDQVNGAFFLVRRGVFEELGGFDEDFFLYFEEVDFSKRAAGKGFVSAYLSKAKAYHKAGGSTDNIRSTRLFYSLCGRFLYARKHFTHIDRFLTVLLAVTAELFVRSLRASCLRTGMSLSEVLRAYWLLAESVVRSDPYLRRSAARLEACRRPSIQADRG